MHGPDPEKHSCILSKNSNKTVMEKQPPLGRAAEPRPQEHPVSPSVTKCHPVSPRSRAGSGGIHLGHSSQEGVGFPISSTALLSRFFSFYSLWTKFSVPLLLYPSSFGGYFHPQFPALFFFAPSPPFSPWTSWLEHAHMKLNPTSQLPALPLAYCSTFIFDSNSAIYTAENSGPK